MYLQSFLQLVPVKNGRWLCSVCFIDLCVRRASERRWEYGGVKLCQRICRGISGQLLNPASIMRRLSSRSVYENISKRESGGGGSVLFSPAGWLFIKGEIKNSLAVVPKYPLELRGALASRSRNRKTILTLLNLDSSTWMLGSVSQIAVYHNGPPLIKQPVDLKQQLQ